MRLLSRLLLVDSNNRSLAAYPLTRRDSRSLDLSFGTDLFSLKK